MKNNFILLHQTMAIDHNMLILQTMIVLVLFGTFRYFFYFFPFAWIVDVVDEIIFLVTSLLYKMFGGHEIEESIKRDLCVYKIETIHNTDTDYQTIKRSNPERTGASCGYYSKTEGAK